jgi:hypothetical protein
MHIYAVTNYIEQWFPTCGTRNPGGYAKIIIVMAENTKKRVKIKTQNKNYPSLVYKERLM